MSQVTPLPRFKTTSKGVAWYITRHRNALYADNPKVFRLNAYQKQGDFYIIDSIGNLEAKGAVIV